MVAEIHQLKTKPVVVNWMCSACGEDASCNCGAPLMSKAQRAAEAIAANPRMSDRAIAADLGIGNATVSRARRETGVSDDTPEERIGRDGKSYPARLPRDDDEETEFSDRELSSRNRGSFLLRVQEAKNFAFYQGKVDEKLVEFARGTAAAWCELVRTLERKL